MILITGSTGLVGQRLVACAPDREMVCLVRPAPLARQFAPGVSVHVVSADVDDLPALRMAMHGVTSIVHLAAISTPDHKRSLETVNVGGTRNVIEAAQEVGVRRLIYVSPIGADPHSAYPYLRTKGQAEDEIRSSGLDYTILRSSAVYGEGDHWTTVMAMGLHALPFVYVIPGDGRGRLQPLHVDDFVECIMRSLSDRKTIGKTMLVGGPQFLTFDDVVNEIMKATGVRRRKHYMRMSSARSLARLSVRLLGRPPFTNSMLDLLLINRTTALDSVSYQFGFQPARMSESLGYLAQPRPWRRMFIRYLMSRDS
jgi:NADH dehydrogenase